jgi:hypothetical protein
MRGDDIRTIVVVSERPHLSATVRERVSPELALIRWTTPAQIEDVWRRCRPWPWVTIGAGVVPTPLLTLAAEQPAVVAWLAQSEMVKTLDWVALAGWERLAIWLNGLSEAQVGNLRLAPYGGVTAGATVVRAPALEALLAAHPRGLKPSPSIKAARHQLTRHALPCHVRQRDGRLHLEAASY